MKSLFLVFLLSSFLIGCNLAWSSEFQEPVLVSHTYIASDSPLLNPERGFFLPYQLPGPSKFSSLRDMAYTLVHLNIHLDGWRDTDIPQDVIDGLDANFADIRLAGIKAILRFSYNRGSSSTPTPDASKAQILRHIEQLAPLLKENSDVIAWMEAGFIGAWGEWHTSTNGLDNIADKREILNALLAALPGRYVQVRYPANIIEMFPDPVEAARARLAHHNDCFLSSDTDLGTYQLDGVITIQRDQAYLFELTRFTPMSGETCAPNPPRSECATALLEMAMLHFSAINDGYHEDVLRSWREGNCLEEIRQRLGYRLTLDSADFNEQVRPGGLLHLTVNMTNTGFASPVNSRTPYVVLLEPSSIYLTPLKIDPRTWQPGSSSFKVKIRLPSDISDGEYKLALWLPDPAGTLRNNPLYAIRFANEGLWDETTGYNLLGTVHVDSTAFGRSRDASFMEAEELSSTGLAP